MWELRSLVRMYLWNHWFSKIPPKNLIDFSPARFNISKYLVYKIFLGWNLSNFSVVFWKIDDFIKDILRLSDLSTGSKNPVRNRLKIQFIELDFPKLIFQKSSTDQQGFNLLLCLVHLLPRNLYWVSLNI